MNDKILKIIDKNLCISCGLCTLNNRSTMVLRDGVLIPSFSKKLENDEDDFLFDICPGKGYPILNISEKLYSDHATNYDLKIGHYISLGASTTKDFEFIKNSSSGGMIPTLANAMLDAGLVDGIVTVKFEYTENGPVPRAFIAINKKDLIESQGSKYRPVALFDIIDMILDFKGSLAVIGTPCQIAGLRLFQEHNKELKDKIKFTIANFCGGYRDYRETEKIFKIYSVDKKLINHFSYRGNGQPGTMNIFQKGKNNIHLKYPDYARLTGFTKNYRCRVCVDATGELADISLGDAWIDRFITSGTKWSFYICRSKEIEILLQKIKELEIATFQDISLEELIKSQKDNITTKKERQNSRFKLYGFLGKSIPIFDGGFNKNDLNILLELKVYISQKTMHLLELFGLYLIFAKIIKRVKKI